jgi:hypothetical protein
MAVHRCVHCFAYEEYSQLLDLVEERLAGQFSEACLHNFSL